MGFNLNAVKTPGGHPVPDAISALQKAIRRGLEEDAVFWATEIDLAGFGGWCWKRLRVITSEDIGLADVNLPATIRALYDNWVDLRKPYKKGQPPPVRDPGRLFLTHAVLLLSRSAKSRIVDHAAVTFYKGDRAALNREIPDYAYDMHTGKGKQLKRGVDHFFDEATYLASESLLPDRYRERARAALSGTTNGGELFEEEDES